MKTAMLLVFTCILLWAPHPARATCLLCSCSATATGVAFGSYTPTATTVSTGTVTVACLISTGSGTAAYSISLSPGNSGSAAARTLTSGGSALAYNMYTTLTYASVWGDGTGGTSTVSDSYPISILTTRNYTVYGRIPSAQNAAAGTYGDSIVVTINY